VSDLTKQINHVKLFTQKVKQRQSGELLSITEEWTCYSLSHNSTTVQETTALTVLSVAIIPHARGHVALAHI